MPPSGVIATGCSNSNNDSLSETSFSDELNCRNDPSRFQICRQLSPADTAIAASVAAQIKLPLIACATAWPWTVGIYQGKAAPVIAAILSSFSGTSARSY